MFGVTILGNNSALPAYDRHPTAQVVTLNDQVFLIDCGEGAQLQMTRYKIRRSKINHIFISHLHGDHYFGLIGFITSMGLLGREHALNLYAPPALKEIIDLQLGVAVTKLPFALNFFPIEQEGLLVDHPKFSVDCFATQHRIPCFGFKITEKKAPRKLVKDKAVELDIPAVYYESLKMGNDYERKDGTIIKNEEVTIANNIPRSYAFCADTLYDELLAEKVKGVSMLYHETTYLRDLEERAISRFHTTTEQAGKIANLSGTNKLLIGHFSSKYENLTPFLEETKEVFENTDLAIEGVTYLIK
jgi:ribonuclease Z